MKGMTLVIPKKHFHSDAFLMPDNDYQELLLTAKKVVEVLKKGLSVHWVTLILEGLGVNHVHVKLYPMHGVEKEFKETWAKEKVFFDTYQGYITTQLGPQASQEELNKIAEEIKNKI